MWTNLTLLFRYLPNVENGKILEIWPPFLCIEYVFQSHFFPYKKGERPTCASNDIIPPMLNNLLLCYAISFEMKSITEFLHHQHQSSLFSKKSDIC